MVTQWLFFMIAFFGAGTLPDGPFWGEVAEDSGLHGQWQGEPEASVEVLPSKYLDDLDVGEKQARIGMFFGHKNWDFSPMIEVSSMDILGYNSV